MSLLDKDIREGLFDILEDNYGKIRIIEEQCIGKSRSDVLVVTDQGLYGIEIKSDADTYARLSSQVKDYDKFYDYNYVVVGTKHASHIKEHVPDYWGVVTVELVDDKLDFYVRRKAKPNPKMKIKYKLSLLWRTELVSIQEIFGMPKYKEKSKDFVRKKILERLSFEQSKKGHIDIDELNREIINIFFERDYTTIEDEIKEYKNGV